MTWCHHYKLTVGAKHIPGCLNVQVKSDPIIRMVTAYTGVQTDLSKVVNPSCRPICHSSKPQALTIYISSSRPTYMGDRCSEHKLVWSRCLCLTSYGSPLQGEPENTAMQLPHHTNSPRLARDALFLGPSAALSGDPTPVTRVNSTSQTVPQPNVPQQPITSEPPCLLSRSGLLQEQGLSVEVA